MAEEIFRSSTRQSRSASMATSISFAGLCAPFVQFPDGIVRLFIVNVAIDRSVLVSLMGMACTYYMFSFFWRSLADLDRDLLRHIRGEMNDDRAFDRMKSPLLRGFARSQPLLLDMAIPFIVYMVCVVLGLYWLNV